ncbi:trehalose-phosphatase [Xanthobacter sp. VTT E-85241]|uniref:trehalose-phosphatase n=1 Tax=Roseixanthobacter finlandensis TaxID=3119922 RepID=UPI002C8F8FB8|nr:trehalose-phosphatase [Xanthobacteraceae bacterium]
MGKVGAANSGVNVGLGQALIERLDPLTCAFFFDVDGTLVDIADHPDAIIVPAELRDNLSALQDRAAGALALVSGRSVEGLDRVFDPLRLPCSGIHGAQMRPAPNAGITSAAQPLPDDLREQLRTIADDLDGVMAEDKGASVAMHYRGAPSIGPVLEGMLHTLVDQSFGRLVVLPGRMVFEVKQAGHDKGLAIRAFMKVPAFAGRTPVFLGDDVTDQAGFAAVSALGGVAVSVGRRFPGVHAVLSEPADVRALIATLAANPIERRN